MKLQLLSRCLVVAAIMASTAAQANSYLLVDLGPNRIPYQANAHGSIAGAYFPAQSNYRAEVFRGGRWKRLSLEYSLAYAINGEGDVVGVQDSEAMFWRRGHAGIKLNVPTGATESYATGISNDRTTVGYYYIDTEGGGDTSRCFRTTADGQTQDLGLPGTGDFCGTGGTNDRDWITGQVSHEASGYRQAFLWKDGDFHNLGSLSRSGAAQSYGAAVNWYGHVVGASDTDDGSTHAFLWNGARMVDIGDAQAYPGGTAALAINKHGLIVGLGFDADHGEHALRFTNGAVVALDSEVPALGNWRLVEATSVDIGGNIFGIGLVSDVYHGFKLVPQTSR